MLSYLFIAFMVLNAFTLEKVVAKVTTTTVKECKDDFIHSVCLRHVMEDRCKIFRLAKRYCRKSCGLCRKE
ncbi:hypothetical protein GCK32_008728 [Trichostrongylus colubriformis]|uniref:ShKT domain-containing protein n=1 Tax=Trichostrongylus colubriformis TaxID=6319 RepID=A0AAN8FZ93_TRICO